MNIIEMLRLLTSVLQLNICLPNSCFPTDFCSKMCISYNPIQANIQRTITNVTTAGEGSEILASVVSYNSCLVHVTQTCITVG
jgi:hypothetical protein